jgi:hypothetical protein
MKAMKKIVLKQPEQGGVNRTHSGAAGGLCGREHLF